MKLKGLLFGVLLSAAFHLSAQVTVDVTLRQEQFLPGEAMAAVVTIVNRSGQTLELGKDQDWLSFAVESKDNYVVLKTGEVPVDDAEFSLGSSKRARKEVDLAPYFNFSKPGRYSLTATLYIKEWNQVITSAPRPFDIISGSKIWEQEVGLPKSAEASETSKPEVRRYVLYQANYLRKLMLYVQISDGMGKVHRVFPIGPLLSFGQPEAQVDRLSNLHVLYQSGPRSSSYNVISPEGAVLIRQEYDMTPKTRLKMNAEGNLEVVGGTRRVTSKDVPPPKPTEATENNAQPPTP